MAYHNLRYRHIAKVFSQLNILEDFVIDKDIQVVDCGFGIVLQGFLNNQPKLIHIRIPTKSLDGIDVYDPDGTPAYKIYPDRVKPGVKAKEFIDRIDDHNGAGSTVYIEKDIDKIIEGIRLND